MEEGFALEEFSFYKQNCFNIFPQNVKKKSQIMVYSNQLIFWFGMCTY